MQKSNEEKIIVKKSVEQSKALHMDFCLRTVKCLGKMVYHFFREDCILKKGKFVKKSNVLKCKQLHFSWTHCFRQ